MAEGEPTQTTVTPVTTPEPKMVLESDLLAVKSGAEKKEGELLGLVAEANRVKEEAHNSLLQMQATKEQLEEQVKEGTATKAQLDELQGKLTTAEESVGNLSTRLLDQKKVNISTLYGVGIDSLTGKTTEQLDNLEEALKLVGKKGVPATLDVGGGGGASVPTTALERAVAEMAEVRSKMK